MLIFFLEYCFFCSWSKQTINLAISIWSDSSM